MYNSLRRATPDKLAIQSVRHTTLGTHSIFSFKPSETLTTYNFLRRATTLDKHAIQSVRDTTLGTHSIFCLLVYSHVVAASEVALGLSEFICSLSIFLSYWLGSSAQWLQKYCLFHRSRFECCLISRWFLVWSRLAVKKVRGGRTTRLNDACARARVCVCVCVDLHIGVFSVC